MTPAAPDLTSAFAPFRFGTFRALWVASIFSNFGGLIQGVGAAWMMTSITESASMVALVQGSTTLPIMLFSLFSGAIADSFDRRRVMLSAQLFMLVMSASLAVVAWFGGITPWLLLGFTFLIGCGTAFNNPSWQATVGDVVPRDALPGAVLLNSVGFNVTRSVGPAIGGAIVAAAGAAAAFTVNAVSYLGLIVVLLRWTPTKAPSNLPRERMAGAIVSGIRYVALSPNITSVMLRGFIFGLTAIAVLALLPLVARHLVEGDALVYGALLGAFGLGAIGGAFSSRPLRRRLVNEVLVRLSLLAFAACATLTALSTSVWLTGLALVIGGGSWVLSLSLFNTTVQLSSPRWVVGRALSLYQMASFGGMALGSWLWGSVAERYSPETALLIAAGGMVLGALLGFRVPLPASSPQNLDPLDRWKAPHVALDILPRSGPIAIRIEYLIKERSLAAFQDAMVERQRIRRRDGARQWMLMRDMVNPERWVESFKLATWSDYLRFHTRTTLEDAPVGDRIRALHHGEMPPEVQTMLVRQPSRTDSETFERSPLDIH